MNTTKLRATNLVRELRDLIQEIHDSGDCGSMLSDVLEMVNELCSKAYQLNLAEMGDEQLASAGLMRKCVTDEMISRAMSVVIGSSGDYGTHNDYLSKDTAREVLEAALSADEITDRDTAKLRAKYHELVEKYDKLAEKYHKLVEQVPAVAVPESVTNAQIHGSKYPEWQCFHCGELFNTVGGATQHFGADPTKKPGCMLKVEIGKERGLLWEYRELETKYDLLRAQVAEAINILAMCGNQTPVDQLGKKLAAALKASAPSNSQQSILPDAATPEMEAAAERYWNERWCTGLTDDPRTWAGVYAAMVAAYRKGE